MPETKERTIKQGDRVRQKGKVGRVIAILDDYSYCAVDFGDDDDMTGMWRTETLEGYRIQDEWVQIKRSDLVTLASLSQHVLGKDDDYSFMYEDDVEVVERVNRGLDGAYTMIPAKKDWKP